MTNSPNALQTAPIPTAYVLDRWHVARAHFFVQMSPTAWEEWRRIARVVQIPAGKPFAFEDDGRMVAAVEWGRLRFLVKGVPPPMESPPALVGPPPKEKAPVPPTARVKPLHAATIGRGDLFGTLEFSDKTTLLRRNVEIEALRDTRIWLLSQDVFRQFVWKHEDWHLPVSFETRWREWSPIPSLRRTLSRAGRVADRLLRARRIPLAGCWGRSMNSRAAALLLRQLKEGSEFDGSALRLRRSFSVGELTAQLGADAEWAKAWARHCAHEHIVKKRGRRWTILEQWRLHHWAETRSLEQAFELPSGAFSFEEPIEADPVLGTQSKTAKGVQA